jgi:hypothetical protein
MSALAIKNHFQKKARRREAPTGLKDNCNGGLQQGRDSAQG